MSSKPLRAVLAGFGNVARKMAAMLTVEREKYPGLAGLDLVPAAWSIPGASTWRGR